MLDPVTILCGDVLERLSELPEKSVHCCVTSPPYYGLRKYLPKGHPHEHLEIGSEKTPELYVARMVEVFRAVWRVLRDDGTLWLNLGDSFARSWGNFGGQNRAAGKQRQIVSGSRVPNEAWDERTKFKPPGANGFPDSGIKPKDMVGIPWRVALALQADGWYLRSDIIWAKPNPMPESVTDRPTKAHEYIFLLTKKPHYFYDAEAIKEPCSESTHARVSQNLAEQVGNHRANGGGKTNGPMKAVIAGSSRKLGERGTDGKRNGSYETAMVLEVGSRNKRSVWTMGSALYSEAHFATFPPNLIKPCILAGTSARGCCAACGAPYERILEKVKGTPASFHGSSFTKGKTLDAQEQLSAVGTGERTLETKTVGWEAACECEAATDVVPCTVLDPFGGSGTTGMVAVELGRRAILIELNPAYVDLARKRTDVPPGLALA